MEPSKEAISVRLARLNNQLLGRSVLSGQGNTLKRSLNREGLLDAISVLYDECNNETLKKSDQMINRFVERYRSVLSELRQLRVNISDFEVKDVIGRGEFGEVHVVREKHTGDVYALKTLRKELTQKQKNATFYEEERDIMAMSKSEWLIKLQFAFQDASQLYLVMEFCPGGDLAGLLDRHGKPLPEKDAIFYLAELTQALGTLHGMGFVHRDIKPDNILLDRCGHLKLGDFGSAARLSTLGKVSNSFPIGTPDYIAPELLKALEDPKNFSHGTPCDFWSFGVLAYELVTCETPFASSTTSKSTTHTYNAIMQHGRNGKCSSLKYPNSSPSDISAEYKDLVKSLLHPLADKRPTYEDILRYSLFKEILWNSLRKQAPPFVPVVNAVDDTSNFVEYDKQKPKPSVDNFRTRSQFSGRNLPFIGFTYAHDVMSDKFSKDSDYSDSSDPSSVSNGFLNTSFNGTSICVSNIREMEKLLESRKREIESLHGKLAISESKQALVADKEKRFAQLDKQRQQLEKDLAEMVCVNKSLKTQVEKEHSDRSSVESESLQLIRQAKRKWQAKHETRISQLGTTVETLQAERSLDKETIDSLNAQLDALNLEASKSQETIESMKELQKNHKVSMTKARNISRQSIVGVEEVTQSSKIQIQTLTQNLNKELLFKNKMECDIKRLTNDLKEAEDREKNLVFELEECKKDYGALKNIQCQDVDDLQFKILELEEQNRFLTEKGSQRLAEGRDISNNLQSALIKERDNTSYMENQIGDLQFSICSLESDCIEKDNQLTELSKEKEVIEARLDSAVAREEKYRDKVATLEDLLTKLQQEVAKLELLKKEEPAIASVNVKSMQDPATKERVAILDEMVKKLEDQLKESREEAVLNKQEIRKANSALWKKEKEFSDCDLDKRIATRELKQLTEKLKTTNEDKKKNTEKHEALVGQLRQQIATKEKDIEKLNQEIETHKKSIDSLEEKLRHSQLKTEKELSVQQRVTAELDRSKNDVHRLKAELQYSENRRLKSEASVERSLGEAKASEASRCQEREERVRLEVTLQEREKECASLQNNYDMLKAACSILEEQLVDCETVIDQQEQAIKASLTEVLKMREELEESRRQLTEKERVIDMQLIQAQAAKFNYEEVLQKLAEERNFSNDLETQLDEITNRESALSRDAHSKSEDVSRLESELKQIKMELRSSKTESVALKEECSRLLTDAASLREEAMRVQLALRECEENNSVLRTIAEETEAELSAQQEHGFQRQLKADATVAQQIKLIDFLQSKVEEASKRKKTFSDMLFGSKSKESNTLPSTPHLIPLAATPSASVDQSKIVLRERQKNRELRERLSALESKIASSEGGSEATGNNNDAYLETPRRSERANSHSRIFMEGWVRIQKGAALERVYMKLLDKRLEWRLENATDRFEIQLKDGASVLIHPQERDHPGMRMSDAERKLSLKIDVSSATTCWPSRSLLVVCPSDNQKNDWLAELQKIDSVDVVIADADDDSEDSKISHSYNSIMQFDRSLMDPDCVVEVDKELYLIGTSVNLFSFEASKSAPVKVSGVCGVRKCLLNRAADVAVILESSGSLVHCSIRQLEAALKAGKEASPHLNTHTMVLQGKDGNSDECQAFEFPSKKLSKDRITVCAATAKEVFILNYDILKMVFIQVRRLDTEPITCMRFTHHTVLLASHKFYEIDLGNYRVEEFLDPSDTTLLHAVFAHKKNIFPIAIVPIDSSGDVEYLLCFNIFGVFVDEFGRRSRSEDIKWSHLPLHVSYRKPFMFVVHFACVEIFHLTENSYRKNSGDSDSVSVSTVNADQSCLPERVTIEFSAPSFLGESSNSGAIYILASLQKNGHNDTLQMCELNGYTAFRRDIGLSIETLDTIEDDACKDSIITSSEGTGSVDTELDTASIGDGSMELKSEFAISIREKAKLINSLKQEKDKVDSIQTLLSGVTKNKGPSGSNNADSSGSDSEVSSCYEERPQRNVLPASFKTRSNSNSQISDSTERSTDSLSSKKQVRFNSHN